MLYVQQNRFINISLKAYFILVGLGASFYRHITNDAKPTAPASLSLIRALRAVKIKIIFYQPDENDGTQFKQSKICIRLAQKALSSLKSEKQIK